MAQITMKAEEVLRLGLLEKRVLQLLNSTIVKHDIKNVDNFHCPFFKSLAKMLEPKLIWSFMEPNHKKGYIAKEVRIMIDAVDIKKGEFKMVYDTEHGETIIHKGILYLNKKDVRKVITKICKER